MAVVPLVGNGEQSARQEGVNDGAEKNQGCNQVEGFLSDTVG
jgi:hypothetical protein